MNLLVVGLGKLGAPIAAVFSSAGHDVIGFDAQPTVRESIRKNAPITEPNVNELLDLFPIRVADDPVAAAALVDVALVVVPTPSRDNGRFNVSMVMEACSHIARGFSRRERPGRPVIVVCSTVMPGDCERGIRTAIRGNAPSTDIGLVYSPEFIALGEVIQGLTHPDFVLIGADAELDLFQEDRASYRALKLYRSVTDAPAVVLGMTEAEIAKLSINTYLTLKVSFANAVAAIAEKFQDADAVSICRAIGTDSRIGRKFLTPGVPYGGGCLPRDTFAFGSFGGSLAESAHRENLAITQRIIERIRSRIVLATMDKPPSEGGGRQDYRRFDLIVLGLAYKPGTAVIEGSHGWEIADRVSTTFRRRVGVHDPLVKFAPAACVALDDASELDAPVVLIANPDPAYRDLSPESGQTFIDLWGYTQRGEGETLRMGQGFWR